LLTWSIGVAVYYLPRTIAGRTYAYDPLIFDVIAFLAFVFIARWTLKSIVANMQLAGMTIPEPLIKWVEDEYQVKLDGMINEPTSVNNREKDKTYEQIN